LVGKADSAHGVSTVEDIVVVLERLISKHGPGCIDEVHYWGHGAPGRFVLGDLSIRQSNFPVLLADTLKRALSDKGLFWLRTCASFHGAKGKAFAEFLSSALDRKVAAHTYNIGLFHSGVKVLRPGEMAVWSDFEGADSAGKLIMSRPNIPGTFLFWHDQAE
jgi:hypothetical protein